MSLITERIQPMLDRKFAAAFVAALLFATPALAITADANEVTLTLPSLQALDTLLPDQSGFSGNLTGAAQKDYATIVIGAFPEIYASNARARAVVLEPFSGSESAVAIQDRDGSLWLVATHSSKWLWQYTGEGREQASQYHKVLKPDDYHEVPIKRCEAPVNRELGSAILVIWKRMLSHTEAHPFVIPPFDVDWAYYSMPTNGGFQAGSIWTSYEQPKVRGLNNIIYDMSEACMKPSRKTTADLMADVASLRARLNSEKPK